MEHEYVRVERQGGVAIVALDRQDRRNALIDPLTHELLEVVRTLSGDESVGALVLTGRGRDFTVGGDLEMLHGLRRRAVEDPDGTARTMRENAELIKILTDLPFPSVAAVNGTCVGAGMGWAGACTVRLGTERTVVNTAYLALGLGTDFGTAAMLSRLLGPSVAADWTLRPRRINAAEAHARGFLAEIVPEGELLGQAMAVAEEWASVPVGAHAMVQSLRQAAEGLALGSILDAEAVSFIESLTSDAAASRLGRSR